MKKLLKSLVITVMLVFASQAFAAAQQGRDYTLLNPAQPTDTKKIEVLEFFFYQCGHCFHLHPFLADWEKSMPADVAISYVPTMFYSSTEPLARTYFALETMGKIKQMDDAIYQAIHVKQLDLYDLDTIGAFVASNGVDRKTFASNYQSFTVNSKIERAKQMLRQYAIDGTPTLIVDGKYKITGLQPADTIRVLNEVIAMARKTHPAVGKASTAAGSKAKAQH
ncbi:MAG: thiol:disulfide interchange protein DsbA/DsbL [Gallionella sp.]|nr:thiol:disulfide interchange protein DsbA/DsbL [Gallionella sp.]MDD4947305.1 thiol:disulfide interchange protein DsbA/DsbL [Gallionella sp.]MDD5613246.1 thiol:disulfide interchange protein DsbA/DsbL [Gallionella sp.]